MNEMNGELYQSFRLAIRGSATNLSAWQDGRNIEDRVYGALHMSASRATTSNDMIARGYGHSLPYREFCQDQSETERASEVSSRPDQEIFHDQSNSGEEMSTRTRSRITQVAYEDIVCYMNAVDALTMSRFGVTHRELMEIKAETEREIKIMGAYREFGYPRSTLASSFANNANLNNINSRSESEPSNVSIVGHEPATIQHHQIAANLEQDQGRSTSDSTPQCTGEGMENTAPMVCLPTGTTDKNQMEGKSRCRRLCAVAGCRNGVVQGGVCISHGAKRKACNYPGCTKPVKKHGKCSAHGPERQRCKAEGCTKVSVQGGKCHSHGAKRRTCALEGCSKQPTVGDMCKRHYDSVHGIPKVHKSRKRKVSESESNAVKGDDPTSSHFQKNGCLEGQWAHAQQSE
ncbi:hypothetical protein HJC23_004274 [Cyclotella cryptica]|uniref:WRKY transcription factor 19 n=1 Tax=Cyclotella cryptica TaxID=29204 RepID=A0ABD3Q494_9STRA|eukprot:CCRYP_008880-RA/>CCRYP_008880-RA protein AED:0.09 eAED:0.09 QI:0/-1/0/1/-1/1/1/0/402